MEAMISGRNGVAVIIDGDRLASIHADEPERDVPRHRGELRFLIGEGRDFEPVENTSRDEIVRLLLLARDREEALQLTLILLDRNLSAEIRQEAAEELDQLLVQQAVVHFVEGVLYAQPLPEEADLPGALVMAGNAGTEKVLDLLARLRRCQPTIHAVRQAWASIPPAHFGTPEEYRRWQSVAVRQGLFRQLVLNRAEEANVNTFFVQAAMSPAARSLPNYRSVLQDWIAPFKPYPTPAM